VLLGVAGTILLQLLFTYLPIMNRLFHTAPIAWDVWSIIIITGILIYLVVEVEKKLRGYTLQGKTFDRNAAKQRSLVKHGKHIAKP
jgi:magnesium-transporting ATPase (P-type)